MDSLFFVFLSEVIIFTKDKNNFNFDKFLKNIFFPNIDKFSSNSLDYFKKLINEYKLDANDVYEFYNYMIGDYYLVLLEKIHEILEDTPSKNVEEEYKEIYKLAIFETFCIYYLILFNTAFIINECFIDENNSQDQQINYINKKNELVSNINKICIYLKNRSTKPISFFKKLLSKKLVLNSDFSVNLIDNN